MLKNKIKSKLKPSQIKAKIVPFSKKTRNKWEPFSHENNRKTFYQILRSGYLNELKKLPQLTDEQIEENKKIQHQYAMDLLNPNKIDIDDTNIFDVLVENAQKYLSEEEKNLFLEHEKEIKNKAIILRSFLKDECNVHIMDDEEEELMKLLEKQSRELEMFRIAFSYFKKNK